jgi:hypothetical protein
MRCSFCRLRRVRVVLSGDRWLWLFACTKCARKHEFETDYPPASIAELHRINTLRKGIARRTMISHSTIRA